MVSERIRPVNYNPGIWQELIKLEIRSCMCSQLGCNEESGVTEGYSALKIPLLPLKIKQKTYITGVYISMVPGGQLACVQLVVTKGNKTKL